MKIITRVVPDDINIFNMGDVHNGSLLMHEDGFNKMVDMVESSYGGLPEDRNLVVDHGDICEGIMIDDKRYDGLTTEASVYQQLLDCSRARDPYKRKIVEINDGNHPWKLWKWFGPGKPGFTEVVCKNLDVPFGTAACVIRYADKNDKTVFKQFACHAGGRGRPSSCAKDPKQKQNNIELGVKDRLKGKMGDTILMSCGHWHIMTYCPPTVEFFVASSSGKLKSGHTFNSAPVGDFIHPDHRHYLCCGSFLKTYGEDISGYAEKMGLDPVELGFYVVRVRDRKIVGVDPIRLD